MADTLGIDVGLSGGFAWLGGLTDSDFKAVLKMPLKPAPGKGNRPDLDVIKDWLFTLIQTRGYPSLVVMEKSQTMRGFSADAGDGKGKVEKKQGAVQAHTQGFNAGMLLGMLLTIRLVPEEPSPQTWKAAVLKGYKTKDKAAMINVCKTRYPSIDLSKGPKSEKDHDGVADAVGLALFGQFRIGNVPT